MAAMMILMMNEGDDNIDVKMTKVKDKTMNFTNHRADIYAGHTLDEPENTINQLFEHLHTVNGDGEEAF